MRSSSSLYLKVLVLAVSAAALAACADSLSAATAAGTTTVAETVAESPLPGGDAAHGQELYETRCIACHSIDENRVGPMHKGLFGRKAGSIADFDYSPAVKAAKIVWGERTLNAWLTDPESLIPGQKMGYSVPDAADRADIIAYLKQATRK
jgi:cytochrome c